MALELECYGVDCLACPREGQGNCFDPGGETKFADVIELLAEDAHIVGIEADASKATVWERVRMTTNPPSMQPPLV